MYAVIVARLLKNKVTFTSLVKEFADNSGMNVLLLLIAPTRLSREAIARF